VGYQMSNLNGRKQEVEERLLKWTLKLGNINI